MCCCLGLGNVVCIGIVSDTNCSMYITCSFFLVIESSQDWCAGWAVAVTASVHRICVSIRSLRNKNTIPKRVRLSYTEVREWSGSQAVICNWLLWSPETIEPELKVIGRSGHLDRACGNIKSYYYLQCLQWKHWLVRRNRNWSVCSDLTLYFLTQEISP